MEGCRFISSCTEPSCCHLRAALSHSRLRELTSEKTFTQRFSASITSYTPVSSFDRIVAVAYIAARTATRWKPPLHVASLQALTGLTSFASLPSGRGHRYHYSLPSPRIHACAPHSALPFPSINLMSLESDESVAAACWAACVSWRASGVSERVASFSLSEASALTLTIPFESSIPPIHANVLCQAPLCFWPSCVRKGAHAVAATTTSRASAAAGYGLRLTSLCKHEQKPVIAMPISHV